MRRILWLPVLALCMSVTVAVIAAEPPHVTFAPAPPGTVTQSQLVYLSGEGTQSQWRAVASKREVGKSDGQRFYARYLSIYSIDGTTYHLRYQSPRNGGPLDAVEKAHGANMWFPTQSMKLVGAAELMQPGVQQLVTRMHRVGADCGDVQVSVIGYDMANEKVVPEITADNHCGLQARIVHEKRGDAISLSGPYYSPTAALCCPTKNKVTAILRFRHGKWVETPKYFNLAPKKFPEY